MSEARKIETEEEEEILEPDLAVLDDASAEMLLERIKTANDQYERMESWYCHQLEKARELRDRTVLWAENCLRGYFDMVPTKNTKTQRSYELPGGKLVLKNQQPEFDHKDDELIPWLKKNWDPDCVDDFVKVKETVNWADLKKVLTGKEYTINNGRIVTPAGEIIPGITATIRDPKFTVTVK